METLKQPLAALALLTFTACYGDSRLVQTAPAASTASVGDTRDINSQALDCSIRQAGSSAVRRLTRDEYLNTVRDLLKDPALPMPELALDGKTSLFEGNSGTPMTVLAARLYLQAAESFAASAQGRLGQLVACDTGMAPLACATGFIEQFGRRALRRPLTAEEKTSYLDLYKTAVANGYDASNGLRWVVASFLQAPQFLHLIERGDASRAEGVMVPLTGYEVASRLSYFYWQTMPDELLLTAAESGALDTAEGVKAQAERLLASPRARSVVLQFYRQVLELDRLDDLQKDTTLFPLFSAALPASMRAETEKFIDHVYWEGDRKLSTLLTADYSFVDSKLAPVYGLSGVTSATPVRVVFPQGQRSGLLTQASVLSMNAHVDQTSPVFRGKFVRERLLCQQLSAPPAGVETRVDPPQPGMTTRQRFAAHSTNPSCGGCHRLMDPIGFGFESYDALGTFRTEESGVPVDARGDIVNGGEVSGPFDGAVAMGAKLAASRLVHGCVVEQWLSFATQRPSVPRDACSAQALTDAFFASGGDLQSVLLSVSLSDSFRYRAPPSVPEVCP